MSEPEISKDIDGSKGRFVTVVDGHEAELTFSILSETMIIADHTGVPDALRGQGIGRKLVEFMVEDARTQGYKITPLCPFVNAQRIHHPMWADVFAV